MKQVRDHAVGDERFPQVVEIEPPRIRRAMGDGLEDLARGMITPDAAVDRPPASDRPCPACRPARSREFRCIPRASRQAPISSALNILCCGRFAPAVELDHWRSVGAVVAVLVGDKEQVGRRADPDAAKPQLDPGEVRSLDRRRLSADRTGRRCRRLRRSRCGPCRVGPPSQRG